MSNRLLDLEASVGQARKQKKQRKPTPVTNSADAGVASRAAVGVSRASAAVDYRTPGVVPSLRQPTPNACWATVTTMMVMWRDGMTLPITTVLDRIGAPWRTMFNTDQGLLSSQKAPFLAAAGLMLESPQSYTIDRWEALLRRYGPLWVTTDEDPSAAFAIHARIMTGIHGDGTRAGTTLDIVDPATGSAYSERFSTFVDKYESEAKTSAAPLRIQVVHWAHDAGYNVARALSTQRAAYAFSLDAQGDAAIDDAEFEPRYDERRAGSRATRAPSAFTFGLGSAAKLTATDIHWAAVALSPEYRNIGQPIDATPFVLNGAVIARLIQLNQFSRAGMESRVVFGLRGCGLDASQTTFVDSVSVRELEPNHIDNRCVIGVWDSTTGKLAAFEASTVPNWKYMEAYRQDHGKKANMLPCGKYDMVVGTHRPYKEDANGTLIDNPGRIRGALRNDSTVVVLRSEDDLTFTVKDTWDKTVANDNIHPGIVAVNAGVSTVPDFSSAGCNTIPGTSIADTPDGDWAAFRTALGLDNAQLTKDDGRKFPYVLLTGRDARLVAAGKDTAAAQRLRFGSDGADVRALQDALAKNAKKYYQHKADGGFGARTAIAFIRYQKDRDGGAADGVVTPADATALGFSLTPTAAPARAGQLGITDKIVDFGRGIFKKLFDKLTARPDESRFVVTSDIAEIMHDDTPSVALWTRKTANFGIAAVAPASGIKDVARLDVSASKKTYHFALTLSFEYNGYDIRNAQIQRRIQSSAGLTTQKFDVKFSAKRATGTRNEVSRIDFQVNGKWDPGLGDKFTDFAGKLYVESDGDISFNIDKPTTVNIAFFAGATFSDVKTEQLAAPKIFRGWKSVFFAVDKDIIIDKELQLFKEWMRDLEKDKIRYSRLREGIIPINVDGYASPTGKGQHNQDLSRKRKEKVKKLLQDELGSAAKIVDTAKGEANPGERNEQEEASQRRADVWFEVAL